jgi:hypothetical protein
MHERVARSHEGTATRHDRSADALSSEGRGTAAAEERAGARSARDRAVRERERARAIMGLA